MSVTPHLLLTYCAPVPPLAHLRIALMTPYARLLPHPRLDMIPPFRFSVWSLYVFMYHMYHVH